MVLARKRLREWKNNPLLFAAIVSLLIHLSIFGGWKLNQRFGWIRENSTPKWIQKISRKLSAQDITLIPPRTAQAVPLVFVDVDPQMSTQEPPKETKFYGAANSAVASAEKRVESELPDIQGTQEKVVKLTENSELKSQPLQPAPEPSQLEEQEAKAPPKETQVPGDLALAKPQEKNKTATGKTEEEEEAERKARQRPRKLEEVKPGLRGERMNQQGGAPRVELESAFDVKITSFGNYDREFIAAVRQCWYELLEGRNTIPGKIVVQFRLNYDGRITDLKAIENTTQDLLLEVICQGAIEKPSPYRKWPTEMRRELKSDSREVRFTFYYE